MIEAPSWIWLHVPKCAGSTTEAILRAAYSAQPDMRFDDMQPGSPVVWHETLLRRRRREPGFAPGTRRVIGNIRRLPSWLLSRIHFEIQRNGAKSVPTREMVLTGRLRAFPPAAQGQEVPLSADWVIGTYADDVTEWIRCECLLDDIARVFELDRDHAALATESRNLSRIDYVRALDFWFTPSDLQALYDASPRWAALERQVYGDILRL